MNNRIEGNNISTEQQALQLVQQVKFSGESVPFVVSQGSLHEMVPREVRVLTSAAGLTPLGTSMWQKILQPLVLGPARAGALQKPVVVIGTSLQYTP